MMDVVPWKGKPSNLVMAPGHGIGVIKEPLERDPARRYKMVCQMSWHAMGVAFSSDGIHWGPLIPTPEMNSAGDCHNNALWSPELKKYVAFTRLWRDRQRVVGRSESADFIHWTKAVEVLRGDDDHHQTYSMPVIRYAGVYIGMVAFFRDQVDQMDTRLAWSPDTINWHRIEPDKALIPNGEKKGDYDWGIAHAGFPIILDNEIRIYYGAGNAGHSDWRKGYLCLATLRPDGFAGYEPLDADRPAIVLSTPRKIGQKLKITADAQGGAVTVSVLDEDGNVLLKSEPVSGNVTNRTVA